MNIRRWIGLVVGLLAVSSSAGQEVHWLRYQTSREPWQVLGNYDRIEPQPLREAPQGLALPQFASPDPLFVQWETPMVEAGRLWLALDRSGKDELPDRLYVDSDADGSLADEQPIKPWRVDPPVCVFGPVRIVFPSADGPIPYHLNVHHAVHEGREVIQIHPGGWYTGRVALGPHQRNLTLIDWNVNGAFNDTSPPFEHTDRIRLDPDGGIKEHLVAQYLQVDDQWFHAAPARDGAAIRIQPIPQDRIPMGRIRVPLDVVLLELRGEEGHVRVPLTEGIGKVPAGRWAIHQWQISRRIGDDTWVLWAENRTEAGSFEVKPSGEGVEPTFIPAGDPLILKLTAAKRPYQPELLARVYGETEPIPLHLNLSLFLETLFGERVTRISTQQGAAPDTPRLHIRSRDGTYDRTLGVMWAGPNNSFHGLRWRESRCAGGPYRIEIEYPDYPFAIEKLLYTLNADGTLEAHRTPDMPQIVSGEFFTVDLRPYCNQPLAQPPSGQTPNDLANLPLGRRKLRGVEFDIVDQTQNDGKSQIRLISSQHRPDLPRQIVGIDVGGQKAARLYFLHAMEWGEEHLEPPKAGEYRIYYQGADDTQVIPILNGTTIGEWWQPKELSQACVGWSGHNGWSRVGLYVYAWQNPHPDRPIASIDFVSDDVGPVLSLIAVTGEK